MKPVVVSFVFVASFCLAAVHAHATGKRHSSGESEITKFMKHLEVVPDVIDHGPQEFLKVSYDSGVIADKGVELTPTQVKNQPHVEWPAEAGSLHTLMLVDPDAPSRSNPAEREFLHWLVVNIPGDRISKADVLAAYVGSGPPKDSGLHRYVFLLYRQPKKLAYDEKPLANNQAEGRSLFSARKFAKKYDLGEPIAGNFYQAKYDDYVPVVHKQLGFSV